MAGRLIGTQHRLLSRQAVLVVDQDHAGRRRVAPFPKHQVKIVGGSAGGDPFGYPIEEAQACMRDQWRTIRTLLAQAIEANGAGEVCVARTISRMPGHALFAGSLAID